MSNRTGILPLPGFPEAPKDGLPYARRNAAWAIAGSAIVSPTAPLPPLSNGQLWWDSTSGDTFIWYDDGNSQQWVQQNLSLQTVLTDDEPPVSGHHGQLWWDSNSGKTYIYYDDGSSQQWVQTNVGTTSAETEGGFTTPQQFGAKGDGIANDGPAIVTALAASKHVYFPPGDYLINGTILTPQSGSSIEGPGRLVKTVWTTNPAVDFIFYIENKDNIVIDGIAGRYPNNGFCDFAYILNSTRVKVTRCKLGTEAEHWFNGALVFIAKNSKEIEVSHNIFYGGQVAIATGGDPFHPGAVAGQEDGPVIGVDILYNAIHRTHTEAIDINWDTHDFRVIGNHGKRIGQRGDATNEIIDVGGSIDGTGSRCADGEIAYNMFEGADTTGNAVGQRNAIGGILVKGYTTGVVVHHNHLTAKGQPGTSGLTFSNTQDCTFHDNIVDWYQKGIYFIASATNNARTHARNNRLLNIVETGISLNPGGVAYLDCVLTGNEILGLAATGNGVDIRKLTGGDISGTWVRGGFNAASRYGVLLGSDSSAIQAHNVRVNSCNAGIAVLAPRTEIVGGLIGNCLGSGLDLQAADIRIMGTRVQDNSASAPNLYGVLVSSACARLHINGLIVDDSRGSPQQRGVNWLSAPADAYITGVHIPRFLTQPYATPQNLNTSVVTGIGALATQAATIATDAVTAMNGCTQLTVDTEAAAATDNLVTITYTGKAGDIMRVKAANSARDVVLKDTGGNLRLSADMTLNNVEDSITLMWSGTTWDELARSDNGA